VSGQETPGLVLDVATDPAPAAADGVWGSLREIGGWWGLLRFLPGAVRTVLSSREPVGGLPVVEPGQSRSAELSEVDFDSGVPITDYTLAAEADAVTAAAEVVAEALAEQSGPSADPAVTAAMTGEALREEWLATHDAGTALQDVIEAHAEQEAEQGYEAWLAQEQADYDAGTGPYAPELTGDATGSAVNGQDSDAAAAVAVAELGEAGL
jgi:hypothetical protein